MYGANPYHRTLENFQQFCKTRERNNTRVWGGHYHKGENMNPLVQNLKEWLRDSRGQIFRFWIYRKMFTPYEENEKFMDESMFEDPICSTGYIREAIILPDNDVLLSLELDGFSGHFVYCKLSEIRLERDEKDMEDYEEEMGKLKSEEEKCRSWKITSLAKKKKE